MIDPLICPPALAERALRAVDKKRGVWILREELGSLGWTIHDIFELMGELHALRDKVTEGCTISELRSLLENGTKSYNANGGKGECLCTVCRMRRIRLEELENEQLSL